MVKYFLLLIRFYQKHVSVLIPPSCRFYPTCSEYSYLSIEKHGILMGSWFTILRIGKCHPLHEGGFDPIK